MPLTQTSADRQLSDGNSQGTTLGQSATDKISFYNATPIVQPSGNAQALITRGQAAGSVVTFASTQSPSSVATVTTAEQAFTVTGATAAWKVSTTDLIYVNKPTAQAGIGMGNVRASASNSIGVTFSNVTAGALTPTASQVYGVVALRGFNNLSATLTPAAVVSSTVVEQQFAVTGLRAGELVQVNKPTSQAGLDIVGARVVSNNLLGISFMNTTTGTLTPTAGESYSVISLGGMDALNNTMLLQVSVGTLGSVGPTTTAQLNVSVTNLNTTDSIMGVSKPTLQAGIMAPTALVSSAGNVGFIFANVTTATITPTAAEIYEVPIYRPNPVAPLVIYTQTLTPVSVAATTTAEQAFTVTGLVSGSAAWVNKPSFTPGLGIAGVRVSAANSLAINYANPTAAAITPPAEAYVIGNFQIPIDLNGTSVVQTAAGVSQQMSQLANAMRGALTSLGMMAGA